MAIKVFTESYLPWIMTYTCVIELTIQGRIQPVRLGGEGF